MYSASSGDCVSPSSSASKRHFEDQQYCTNSKIPGEESLNPQAFRWTKAEDSSLKNMVEVDVTEPEDIINGEPENLFIYSSFDIDSL